MCPGQVAQIALWTTAGLNVAAALWHIRMGFRKLAAEEACWAEVQRAKDEWLDPPPTPRLITSRQVDSETWVLHDIDRHTKDKE